MKMRIFAAVVAAMLAGGVVYAEDYDDCMDDYIAHGGSSESGDEVCEYNQ